MFLGRMLSYGGEDVNSPKLGDNHPGTPAETTVDSNQDVGTREDSKDRRARIMAEQDAQRGGSQAEIKEQQQDRIDERVLDTAVRRSGGSEAHRDYALEHLQSDAPPMEIRRQEEPDMMAAPEAVEGPEEPARPDFSGKKKGWDLGDLWGPNSRFNRYREDKAAELESLPVSEKEQKQASNKMASFEGPTPWSEKGSPETYHSEGQRDAVQIDQIQKWIGKHGGFGGENQEQIKSLQGKLKNMGFYKGDIDGSFGPQSLKALRLFQSGRGATDEEYDSRMSSYT